MVTNGGAATAALAALIALGGLVFFAAGCGPAGVGGPSPSLAATPDPAASAASPSATSEPSGPRTITAGALAPGDYATTTFKPTMRFTLGEGWAALGADDPTGIGFDRTDETGLLAFTRLDRVVDPTTHKAAPAPDDLLGWLLAHPAFEWSAGRTPVEIAGLAGEMVEGHVRGMGSTDLFYYDEGNLRVTGGAHVRFYMLPLDGRDLTIVVAGYDNETNFEVTSKVVQTILDSLEVSS